MKIVDRTLHFGLPLYGNYAESVKGINSLHLIFTPHHFMPLKMTEYFKDTKPRF